MQFQNVPKIHSNCCRLQVNFIWPSLNYGIRLNCSQKLQKYTVVLFTNLLNASFECEQDSLSCCSHFDNVSPRWGPTERSHLVRFSVSCFFFFFKSCLLFHFLHFYFLLLFPCLFCCLMTFTSVLLSVLPLVVLTCVPLPSCINSVCLFPHGCLFRLIHRLWFARIIITTYYYHYLPTNRSGDLGQWSHGRCELASGWNGGGVISGTCGDKNPVDSVLICQGLSVWSLHFLPVSWWVLSRYSNFLPQLPPTVQASPTCVHHHWTAASDSARWVLDKQWFKKDLWRLCCSTVQLLPLNMESSLINSQ